MHAHKDVQHGLGASIRLQQNWINDTTFCGLKPMCSANSGTGGYQVFMFVCALLLW